MMLHREERREREERERQRGRQSSVHLLNSYTTIYKEIK